MLGVGKNANDVISVWGPWCIRPLSRTQAPDNDGDFSLICDWSAPVPASTSHWRACRRMYTPYHCIQCPCLDILHVKIWPSDEYTVSLLESCENQTAPASQAFLWQATSLPMSKLHTLTVPSHNPVANCCPWKY
jgi:hypothetical protein